MADERCRPLDCEYEYEYEYDCDLTAAPLIDHTQRTLE